MTYRDQARCAGLPSRHIKITEDDYTPEPFVPQLPEVVVDGRYGHLWDMTTEEIFRFVMEFKSAFNSNVIVWLATPLWERMIDNESAKIMLQQKVRYNTFTNWKEGYYNLGIDFCNFAHDPRIPLNRNVDPIFIRTTKHLKADEIIAPMVRMERGRKEAERLNELPLFGRENLLKELRSPINNLPKDDWLGYLV